MGIHGFSNNSGGGFDPGEAIYAKSLNKLAQQADRGTIGPSEGLDIINSNGGTSIFIPPKVDYGVAQTHCPFELYLSTREYKGQMGNEAAQLVPCIKVWPGTVNNIVPIWVPYDDTPLDEQPPPFFPKKEGGIDNGGLKFDQPFKYYFYLDISGSGSSPEQFTFPQDVEFWGSESPAPQNTDYHTYLTIGYAENVAIPNTSPVQYAFQIVNLTACGSKWVERLKCGTNLAEYYWGVV